MRSIHSVCVGQTGFCATQKRVRVKIVRSPPGRSTLTYIKCTIYVHIHCIRILCVTAYMKHRVCNACSRCARSLRFVVYSYKMSQYTRTSSTIKYMEHKTQQFIPNMIGILIRHTHFVLQVLQAAGS